MGNNPRQTMQLVGAIGNLPAALDSVFDVDNSMGYSSMCVTIAVPTGGTIAFFGTYDGINFFPITLQSVASNGAITYLTQVTASGNLIGSIVGMLKIRFKVTVAGSAVGSVAGTLSYNVSVFSGFATPAASPPVDYESTVARGLLDGISIVNKYGRNPTFAYNNTPRDMWDSGGLYTGFPAAGQALQVLSNNAADAAAGTGAKTVVITGMQDTDFQWTTVSATLNGTTAVNIPGSWVRVHRIRVETVGTGGSNAGTITVKQATSGAVLGTVAPGYNHSCIAAYTIPQGYTGWLKRLGLAIRGGYGFAADGCIYTGPMGGPMRQYRPFTLSSSFCWKDDPLGGVQIPEKNDIMIRITSTSIGSLSGITGAELVCDYDIHQFKK